MISSNAPHAKPGVPDGRATWQPLLLAAGFLVLVGISAFSVILVDRAREDNDWVVHTVEVENQISTLQLRIRTTESAARGYLLTDEQRFLDEYLDASSKVHADIDELIRLAGDNPAQIDNSNQMRAPVQARLDEFERAINFARQHDTAGGIAMLRENPIPEMPTSASATLPAGCGRKKSACSRYAPRPPTGPSALPRS